MARKTAEEGGSPGPHAGCWVQQQDRQGEGRAPTVKVAGTSPRAASGDPRISPVKEKEVEGEVTAISPERSCELVQERRGGPWMGVHLEGVCVRLCLCGRVVCWRREKLEHDCAFQARSRWEA